MNIEVSVKISGPNIIATVMSGPREVGVATHHNSLGLARPVVKTISVTVDEYANVRWVLVYCYSNAPNDNGMLIIVGPGKPSSWLLRDSRLMEFDSLGRVSNFRLDLASIESRSPPVIRIPEVHNDGPCLFFHTDINTEVWMDGGHTPYVVGKRVA